MLNESEWEQVRKDAEASYRRHKYSIRGQMITPADDYEWHLEKKLESALLAKIKLNAVWERDPDQ